MSKEKNGLVLKRKEVEYVENSITGEVYYITYCAFDISIEIALHTDRSIHFYTSGGVIPRLSLCFLEKLVKDCEEFLSKKSHLKEE